MGSTVNAHNCKHCNARSGRNGDHKITNTITVLFPICWWHHILALPSDMINSTLSIFNCLHKIMEIGVKDGICFLDTTIIINNQRIIFNTYHKAIFSGKFLNFYSNHPLCHKRDTIISFFRQNILSVTLAFNKKIWSTQFTFFLKMIIFFFIFSTIEKRN